MASGIAVLLLKAEDKNRWSVILHHADGRGDHTSLRNSR